MACDLTAGRLEPCKSNVGGIDKIFFVNFGDFGDVTLGSDDNEITDVTGSFSAYEYEVKATGNTFEQTINSSRDNGTTFFTQTVNLTLKNLTKEMHKELKLMAYGRPHVVVLDRNGNSFVAGLNRGCEVTGGTVVTGGAMGDLSGYTITLTAEEELPAPFLNSADPNAATYPFDGFSTGVATIVTGS